MSKKQNKATRISYYMAKVELVVSDKTKTKGPYQIFDEIQEIEKHARNYLKSILQAHEYEVEEDSKIFP